MHTLPQRDCSGKGRRIGVYLFIQHGLRLRSAIARAFAPKQRVHRPVSSTDRTETGRRSIQRTVPQNQGFQVDPCRSDSSVLVAAERQGQNARQMLSTVSANTSETEIDISVVTLIERLNWRTARPAPIHRNAKQNGVSLYWSCKLRYRSILLQQWWRFVPEKSTARIKPEDCGCHCRIC